MFCCCRPLTEYDFPSSRDGAFDEVCVPLSSQDGVFEAVYSPTRLTLLACE